MTKCTLGCHLCICWLTVLVVVVPVTVHGLGLPGAPVPVHAGAPWPNARFQTLLETAVRDGLPGVSLRVLAPGIDFQGAAGVANLVTGEPLSANHVLYTASLGKTFTATVALQFCEEGRLDLAKAITTWLPGDLTQRIPDADKITLRHLLSHKSGLIDYLNDDKAWRSDFVRDAHRQWTHSDVIPYLYDKPLRFQPGGDFDYSNSNYILVGLILERVSGEPLHALIRKRILAPLKLQRTFNGHETPGSDKRAHGYIKRRGRILDTYPWYSHFGLADAGIHSTPRELAVFIRSLLTGSALLSARMRAEMTAVSPTGVSDFNYGMGIYVQQNPWGAGWRWYAHDGIDPGYQADMMYLPELDLTIVLCANASLGEADPIYQDLITAVVDVALDTLGGPRPHGLRGR